MFITLLTHQEQMIQDSNFLDKNSKEVLGLSKIIESYIRNEDFVRNLIKFNEITVHHVLYTLREKEGFSGKTINQIDLNEDLFNIDEVTSFKILPCFLIKNLVFSTVLLRSLI